MAELGTIFSRIYANNIWGSGSGPGSDASNVEAYVRFLQWLIRDLSITSIVDCGCGDWQLMRNLDLTGIRYTGIDIVPNVIDRNQECFGSDTIRFVCDDFAAADLPPADLVICKDALQHLPDEKVFQFLAQLERFKCALITNDVGENADRNCRLDAAEYFYAPIDITRAPFNIRAQEMCRTMGAKTTHLVQNFEHEPRLPGITQCKGLQNAGLESGQGVSSGEGAELPRVLLAILAKQKEAVLPLYLKCIESLDYPKARITLSIRTNNNTDRTRDILKAWIGRVARKYAYIHFDDFDVPERVQEFEVHEWNAMRFSVLGRIRRESMQQTHRFDCDYYFVVDVDNFLRPKTLRELVSLRLPLVAPLLQHEIPGNRYSNYHYKADSNGYYKECPEYDWILTGRVRGIVVVDVVHCTYLVRRDVIDRLSYEDATQRHEYVVFSESARRAGIPQYLDNREVYGYLTLAESAARSETYLAAELASASRVAAGER